MAGGEGTLIPSIFLSTSLEKAWPPTPGAFSCVNSLTIFDILN